MSFSGYVLNAEHDSFYYLSLSRLHPQRIHATKKLSESTADPFTHSIPCAAVAKTTLGCPTEAPAPDAESEVGVIHRK